MLERARQRQRYQRLEQADLVGMMANEPPASYDIVTSADVFIYVGNIDASVQQVRRVLKPGGLFLLSVESFMPEAGSALAADQQDFHLETSGRYAHAAAYLDRLASLQGFTIVERTEVDVRVEQNKPIKGWLDVWRVNP
jgi:predicted TPR repeat methyltransferase